MRVLMLGWFGDKENSGGMEVHLREISKGLSSHKISVLLSVPKGKKHRINAKNVEIIEIPCKTNAKSINEVIENVHSYNQKIICALKSANFDAIHSHDWLCIYAAKKLKGITKKPWIHTVHSLEHIRATEKTRSKISRIEKEGIMLSDTVITVSALMKKEILKEYKIPAEKIHVVRNHASIGFVRKINNNERDTNTVLFVGRLALQKGVETLISAFPEILKRVPEAKLIIAGDGNLKKGLIALTKIKGIEKSVLFKGHVDERILKRLYSKATVFVLPSAFEPFGITVLDAAYFGIPIIATKKTGALECFEKNSIVCVEPENKTDMAEKIVSLLLDEKRQKELSENAKKDIQSIGGWNDIAEKTAKIYEHALHKRHMPNI